MAVTERQKQILGFIESYRIEHGRSPTRGEIATHFGFSSMGTVQRHLDRLVSHGLLLRNPHKHRSLSPSGTALRNEPHTGSDSSLAVVPLLGMIRAGAPVESFSISNLIDVPRWLLEDGEHFALRVAGESMMGEGILDGDTILVRRQPEPRPGDVVVALVGGEATVKRYYPMPDGIIELRPSNPSFLPIRIRPESDDDLVVQGVVVGLLRKMA